MSEPRVLLAIDVGNTQTVVGAYRDGELRRYWRISTHPRKTSDEWSLALSELLTINGKGLENVNDVIICSVVPDVTQALESMCRRTLGVEPMLVGSGSKSGIAIKTDNPEEMGADRIANAAAAYKFYGGPAVVVDFGTATTFDVISGKGEYLGGAIAPGIEISLDALFARAAKLSEVELSVPEKTIGTTTADSLRSGAVFGYAGLVDTLVFRIIAELKAKPGAVKVIATGGLVDMVAAACASITNQDPLLTLKGLKLIWDLNQ